GLKSVTIPNSVRSIGSYTFYNCQALTNAIIPNSVTNIGSSAFENCSELRCVAIPDFVNIIGERAFYGCKGLTSITIPNTVTSIGNYAFSGCSGLKNVTLNSNSIVSKSYSSYSEGSILKDIFGVQVQEFIIGNSVTSIGYRAFEGFSRLSRFVIPNSVNEINGYSFADCSNLKTIILPISLQTIGTNAFRGLSQLKDVYCYARTSPKSQNENSNFFNNTPIGYATLHVPEKSLEIYETTSPWSGFMKIVPLTESDPNPSDNDFPGGGEGDEQCAKPTIGYNKGKLIFNSATDDAVCRYTISDSDITSSYGNEVQLTVTYTITAFATKNGYRNSDAATATLCWIDVEPKTEGITNDIANIPANALLIQTENGQISVSGANDGTAISVFGTDGLQVGSAVSRSGQAVINTNLSSGSIAIVKIGNRSVKVAMK
ncbi:MAG: leucine-rich repeat domain-containing protein, partial [Prevotella sp.]|nr:leucine-rich repeat domain-containing protein [Prevotella sp.]